jgi:hypothetical protein
MADKPEAFPPAEIPASAAVVDFTAVVRPTAAAVAVAATIIKSQFRLIPGGS